MSNQSAESCCVQRMPSAHAVILIGVLLGILTSLLFLFDLVAGSHPLYVVTAFAGIAVAVLTLWLVVSRTNRSCLAKYVPLTLFASLFLIILSILALASVLETMGGAAVVAGGLVFTALYIALMGLYVQSVCIVKC